MMPLLQDAQVNFLGVLIAAVVYFLLGGLWYSPKVFGNYWMKHEGLHLEQMKPGAFSYIGEFIVDLIVAYVLAILIDLTQVDTLAGGAMIGLLIWIGFIATSQLSSFIWSHKTFKSLLVNAGFVLVGLLAMGAIIGGLREYYF